MQAHVGGSARRGKAQLGAVHKEGKRQQKDMSFLFRKIPVGLVQAFCRCVFLHFAAALLLPASLSAIFAHASLTLLMERIVCGINSLMGFLSGVLLSILFSK